MSIESSLVLVSLEHVEHVSIVLVLRSSHYNGHNVLMWTQSLYPTDAVVYGAWLVLCESCGFRIDSL